MRSSAVVAPRSRAFGFATSTDPMPVWIERTGSWPCPTVGRHPAGNPQTPPPPLAGSAAWRQSAEFQSTGRQFHLADGEGQLYSHPWRSAPVGGSGGLITNPVTPPPSHRHHPVSGIAHE